MKRTGFVWMFVGWLLVCSLAAVLAGAQEAPKAAAQPAAKNAADPLDWPYWRGPEWNSISRETGLPDTINPGGGEGSNLAWKREDLGARSTPIVLRGKLYYLARHNPATQRKSAKRSSASTPKRARSIWESIHNVWSSDVPDTRVGWVEHGRAIPKRAMSMLDRRLNGLFKCLERRGPARSSGNCRCMNNTACSLPTAAAPTVRSWCEDHGDSSAA
jgi:hypothetical protein